MAIRRTRKKLTTLISDIDKRLNSTTLRQIKRTVVPPSDVEEEEETSTDIEQPIGNEISSVVPDRWAKIVGGFYYPPSLTGGLGQVELFVKRTTTDDLTLSIGNLLYVSGIEVEWSGGSFSPNTTYTSETKRKVLQIGNPSWTGRGRANSRPTYAAIPAGVTDTIIYTVANKSVIPGRNPTPLTFRAKVSNYFATKEVGTITFTAAHHFKVGHILDISDLPAPFRDVDGIIQVSAVPSTTQISFNFSKSLAAEIPSTPAAADDYVNGCVDRFTKIGSSWIDTSSTPNKVFIWDGVRYTGMADALEAGIVENDGIAPSPPTDLSLSSYGYAREGAKKDESRSAVELSWTAPTTNANGGDLTDLAGYRVWISTTSATGPWPQKRTFGLETSQTILNLTPNRVHYFAVIAFDKDGLDSTQLRGQIKTTLSPREVQKPSTPIIKSNKLSVVVLEWDGKDASGLMVPLRYLEYIEVHASQTSGFTPSESTLIGEIRLPNGLYAAADLEYNKDYYFKFVAIDIHDRASDPSEQVSAKVKPLVDADLIAAELNSPLSVWPFAPGSVTAGALSAGSINASNVFGAGVVVQAAIAANAIGANQIASNAITAGKIEAGAVTSAKIAALAITADKIEANAITADKIRAGSIDASKINASYIYGNVITGNQIVAGTITATSILMTEDQYSIMVGSSSNNAYFRVAPNAPNGVGINRIGIADTTVGGVRGSWIPEVNGQGALGLATKRWSRVFAVNTTISDSDRRIKTDIKNATLGLEFINKLNPVSYKYIVGSVELVKDSNGEVQHDENGNALTINKPGVRRHWGLIAQEVKEALDAVDAPDFAGYVVNDMEDPESHLSLSYEQFISPLIKAVQELSDKVEILEREIKR